MMRNLKQRYSINTVEEAWKYDSMRTLAHSVTIDLTSKLYRRKYESSQA